jgi:hypothetical protein
LEKLKTILATDYVDAAIDLQQWRTKRSASPRKSQASKPQAFTYASIMKYLQHVENHLVPYIFYGFLNLFQQAKTSFQPLPFATFSILRGEKVPLAQTTPPVHVALPHYDPQKRKVFVDVSDALDPDVWNVHYSILDKVSERNNDSLLLSGVLVQYESSHKNDQLVQITYTLDVLHELFEDAEEALHDLQRSLMPKNGHDFDHVKQMLELILEKHPDSVLNVKQTLEYLQTAPSTYIMRDKCKHTIPNTKCGMYLLTFVPIIKKRHVYDVYRVELFPTLKPGMVTNDWITPHIDEKYILANEYKVKPYIPEDAYCRIDQVLPCDVCVSKRVHKKDTSQCLRAILQKDTLGDILQHCDYTKVNEIYDQAVYVDELNIAYLDVKPGTIIEDCGGNKETSRLSSYGIMHLEPNCSYELVNGPLTIDDAFSPRLTISENADDSQVTIYEMEEPTVIRNHLRQNAVEYVIGLSVSLLTVTIVASIGCYCCSDKSRQITVRPSLKVTRRTRHDTPPRRFTPFMEYQTDPITSLIRSRLSGQLV